MEYHCFLCRCVYPTVNNFIVSEHIEPACFLSHFIEMKVQLGSVPFYKTLLLIRIFRKTVRQEQIQDTKSTRNRTSVFTTELNRSVFMNRNSVFLLCFNLQFDMLDFNTGFALVVRLVNTIFPKKLPDGTFSSI